MKAVFDKAYISNLDGDHVKEAPTKADLAKLVMDDIENFRDANDCERVVMVWCGYTEKYIECDDVQSVPGAETLTLPHKPPMCEHHKAQAVGIPRAVGQRLHEGCGTR